MQCNMRDMPRAMRDMQRDMQRDMLCDMRDMQRDMQCDMRDMQLVYAIGHARVGTWETCNVPRHAHNALPTFEPGRAPRVITASTCHASPTVLPTMKAQSSVVTRSHSSHPRSIWLRYSVRISYDRLFAHRRRFSRTYHRGIPASLCAKHKVLFKGRSEMDIVICHRASLLV